MAITLHSGRTTHLNGFSASFVPLLARLTLNVSAPVGLLYITTMVVWLTSVAFENTDTALGTVEDRKQNKNELDCGICGSHTSDFLSL